MTVKQLAYIVQAVTRNPMVGAALMGISTTRQMQLAKSADEIAMTASIQPNVHTASMVTLFPLECAA